MPDDHSPVDVAIIGGGIAGLCLAINLLNKNIPTTVYESAHHFGEIGAGVYFQPNAVRAMKGIDPAIEAAFDKVSTANASPDHQDVWFDFRHGEGEKAGEQFYSVKCPGPHAGVHRAKFLDELIKLVPQDVAHFGCRMTGIEEVDGKVNLTFRDGSVKTHSCVIGCDGIHSEVRKYILGADHPAARAVYTGKYCHRGLLPMDKAISILGEGRAMNSQVYFGKRTHLMTFPVEKGKTFNAVAFSTDASPTWDHPKWFAPGSFKDIQEDFSSFRGPPKQIIDELQNTDIWALFDNPPATTFCRGNVGMIGDAAHASTPHQGSGAGVAIEDAYVLGNLLAGIGKVEDVGSCLKAFDGVRRQRGLDLVSTSREAGLLWELEHPVVGNDWEGIGRNAQERLRWIWEVDLEGHIQEGLRAMRT